VTFPKRVMGKLHLREGGLLSLEETRNGILIKPHRFDSGNLAPLRGRIPEDLPAPDFEMIRPAARDPRLRD